ncbi:Tetratricopeptide repeat protein 33 [Willisornis vidua]|uniref:Tetratricopeptide repeat protein 33 n=1 Tax=Willisornis vidua TaxID=1566151 RepID=A0ABQ9CTZ3_9PASS|nr:Tetratricopeptide repeat protein 33 [Willisornis vidua]
MQYLSGVDHESVIDRIVRKGKESVKGRGSRALSSQFNLKRICKRHVMSADQGKLVDANFLDFSKAFDTVSHKILLEKMSSTQLDKHIMWYREAILKWDEALQLTPEDATLYEMKSQAIRSFQVSLHIFPMNPEVWKEDLSWARKLHEQQKATKIESVQALLKQKELAQEPIPDYDFESDEIVAVCAAIAEKEKALSAAKTVVIVSASGAVETVTEKDSCPATPDETFFIRAR